MLAYELNSNVVASAKMDPIVSYIYCIHNLHIHIYSYIFLKCFNNWGRIRMDPEFSPVPESGILKKVVAECGSGINHSGFTTLFLGQCNVSNYLSVVRSLN